MTPAAAQPIPWIDRKLLVVDTALSIASAVVSSALGASWLGSLILAALAPAVLTYVHHRGPGRRRRTAIGLALYALLHFLQALLARLRGRQARPRVRGAGHALRFAEVTAGVAFAITVVTLTAPELVLGDSLVSGRPLTLFPGHEPSTCPAPSRPHDPPTATTPEPETKRERRTQKRRPPASAPTPHPQAVDPDGPPPDRTAPALELPADIKARATGPGGAVVRFTATAVDGVDGPVPVSCRPPSGSRFRVGTTTVDCSAQDHARNHATGGFQVRVSEPRDVNPPPSEPSEPGDPDPKTPEAPETPEQPPVGPPVFTGPRTIIVDTTESEDTPVSYDPPPAVDGNGRPARVDCSPTTVPAGTRAQVSCTATDSAGQTTPGSFVVSIRIVDPG